MATVMEVSLGMAFQADSEDRGRPDFRLRQRFDLDVGSDGRRAKTGAATSCPHRPFQTHKPAKRC
jgi:hypothetical protein